MAAASWARLVTLFSVLLGFSNCLSVPVISWWADESINAPAVISGHSIDKKEFQSLFKPILSNAKVLVLFLQDEISIDDFTKYGDSFPYIKASIQNNQHIVLPSVQQDEEDILDYIKDFQKTKEIEVSIDTELNTVANGVEDSVLNIVYVKLEPIKDTNSEAKATILKRNDAFMKKVISSLIKSSETPTVLYTAEDMPLKISNILINENMDRAKNSISRHILQSDEANQVNGTVVRSNCVLMYFQSIMYESNSTLKVLTGDKNNHGECNNETSSIVLNIDDTDVQNITIMLQSQNNTGLEWACQKIHVDLKDETVSFDCGMQNVSWRMNSYNTIVSPIQYSFVCNSMMFKNNNKTLSISGLQIQPISNGKESMFKDAYNCEGFFTLPILTGLFVGALLIAGLYLGTIMMMNIQVQDRFDDPKGKTITVAAQE